MAYFNHAFTKMFLGTGNSRNLATTGAAASNVVPYNPYSAGGMLLTTGTPTVALAKLPIYALPAQLPTGHTGYFGFFDPKTNLLIDPTLSTYGCCPLMLASSSVLQNDKIGPFHGGYQETNKSKLINPKYVQNAYRVDSCVPQQAIVSIGNTPQTAAPTTPNKFQGGTTAATCCFEFFCGETYYLRVDVKGSPALRALNHNAYQTLDAYTGCCPGPTPTLVDSTTVMISWAKEIVINNYLKNFVLPVVFSEAAQVSTCDGVAYSVWYAPGTTIDPITLAPVAAGQSWDCYPVVAHGVGLCAGLRLFGAYVGTVFGDCTFQLTDFFEKEPVKILASMVDYTGDPCVFEGICVYNDCLGLQGMGFGDQVVKDLILAESYLQNFFANNDLRIREITQGYDMTTAINRNALYTRYFLLHSVPRWNNPTGVFDADRYMLEIITTAPIAALDTFLTNWLTSCADCVPFDTHDCVPCVPVNN